MATVRDISEMYYGEKEQHLNKKIFVDVGNKIIEANWIHTFGDKVIITLKK